MKALQDIATRLKSEFNRIQSQISSITVGGIPAGLIFPFAGTTPPSGFLLSHGQEVSRSTYSALFAVIGINFGEGDGVTTFNLPDLRGRFIRYTDTGAGRDPDAPSRSASGVNGATGDNVGSVQDDENKIHAHGVSDPGHAHNINLGGVSVAGGGAVVYSSGGSVPTSSSVTGISINQEGGNESRPKNIYLNGIIKY